MDENLSVTLPRRLGLSHVVDAQVRRYREDARRNRRVPEPEVVDLIRLVARRPDARDVFHRVGRSLGGTLRSGWRHALPRGLLLRHARRRASGLLRDLFGKGLLTSPRGTARLEEARDLLHVADPSGQATAIITGAIEATLEASGRFSLRVRQVRARARGDAASAWEIELHRPEIVPVDPVDPGQHGDPRTAEGVEAGHPVAEPDGPTAPEVRSA